MEDVEHFFSLKVVSEKINLMGNFVIFIHQVQIRDYLEKQRKKNRKENRKTSRTKRKPQKKKKRAPEHARERSFFLVRDTRHASTRRIQTHLAMYVSLCGRQYPSIAVSIHIYIRQCTCLRMCNE